MKLAVLKERATAETRVAASPETVRKLCALGLDVCVERGAGKQSHLGDDAYEQAGAELADSLEQCLEKADVVLKVRPPSDEELARFPSGATLIGMLEPHRIDGAPLRYAKAQVNAFAMELLPRITRAQSMDVLSSQSNLAGYRAVIDAAAVFNRAMPMMMTAAGTVAPAKVLVMGAGVAGLQAIATARRLGAIVTATDVRMAAKEQVESLGASFLMVEPDGEEDAETAGGYAREMSEDSQARQAALVARTIATQDIVILPALIPGRPAPTLVTAEMVTSMKPGSVIFDLAVEQGGNCPLSQPDETVLIDGITILGPVNTPGRLSTDASALYARNLFNFLAPMLEEANGQLAIDWQDEIICATALTRSGEVVHPGFCDE